MNVGQIFGPFVIVTEKPVGLAELDHVPIGQFPVNVDGQADVLEAFLGGLGELSLGEHATIVEFFYLLCLVGEVLDLW